MGNSESNSKKETTNNSRSSLDQQFLHVAPENVVLMTGQWAIQDSIVSFSEEVFQLLEIDQSSEASFDLIFNLIWEAEPQPTIHQLKRLIEGENYFQTTIWIKTPKGNKKNIQIEGSTFTLQGIKQKGGLIKVIAEGLEFFTDCRRIVTIFDSMDEFVWMVNQGNEFAYANESFQKEFIERYGRPLRPNSIILGCKLLDSETIEFWEESYARAFKGEQFSLVRTLTIDGIKIHWDVRFIPVIIDHKIPYVACILRNITDKIKSEHETHQLIEKLNLSQKISRLGYWEFDLDTEEIFWSDEVYEIWGIPKHSLKPNFESFIQSFPPEDREEFVQEHMAALSGEKPLNAIHRIITPNGKIKYVREKGELTFSDGKIRFIGTVQDISEEHQLNKLLESKTKLISKTAEITQSFLEAENWEDRIDDMLQMIGEATDVDRASLIRIYDSKGVMTNEWTNGIASAQLDNPDYKSIPVEEHPEIWHLLNERKPFSIRTSDTSGATKKILEEQSIVSILIVPIFVGNEIFGFVVLDNCDLERVWSEDEMNFLNSTTTNLAFVIEKKFNLDENKRALNVKNSLLESIRDSFYALDKNYKVTYWNNVLEKLTGVSRSEIIGKSIWDYVKEVNSDFREAYKKVLDHQETVTFESFDPWVKRWLDVTMYPSADGLSAIIRDISDRKESENKINEFNERFKLISQASTDAIWDINFITKQHYWGEGFDYLFGEEIAGFHPDNSRWLERIFPEDRDVVTNYLDQCLQDPSEEYFQVEYRFSKKGKGFFYLLDRGIIKRDEDGKPTRMVGIIQDITNRKAYEESLKILNKELLEANQELEATNKELEQFAFVASHDLQEPLRRISSFLGLLEKKYSPVLDSTALKYIHFAVDGAKRMRSIILDLLEFSRLGNISEKKVWAESEKLVNDVILLNQRDISEKQAKIHLGTLPTINCHPNAIIQVFQNLISNGLKYQPAGQTPEIWISGEELGDQWKFEIRDNGIGIEEEYLDKIFVIFQRLHQKDQYSGTGIGLSICKKIVEYHGGKIWAESIPGQGSTFYFTLKK